MIITEGLKDFAVTDRQKQILDAYLEHGSFRKAAVALGLQHSTVQDCLTRVRARAAKQGYSGPVPTM